MATKSTTGSLGDLPAAFMNLLNAQMKLSADLFESFTGQKLPTVGDLNKLGQQVLTPGATGCAPKGSGCCTIPAPCWMPRSLGECTSHVGQCNNACIRFVVTNCDRVQRTITAHVSGANASKVTISPPSVVLGPQERATISACVAATENQKRAWTNRTDSNRWPMFWSRRNELM